MSCEKPLLAVNLGKKENGKMLLKIIPSRADYNIANLERKYGHDNLLMLPCGKCAGCRASHQKQWALRCSLEAALYTKNCMVTLTYDQEQCPKKLVKRDFQKFIKDLRNDGYIFRYFGCGEYGSQNGRPHYHIILFNFWPNDAIHEMKSDSGFPLYKSKYLEEVWSRGLVRVSEVSPGTAAYVAGYVDKKIGQGEFVLMSKRPGIGQKYFEENLVDIYKYDCLVGAFGVQKVPRYCDKIAESLNYDIVDIKEDRKKKANENLIETINAHNMQRKEDALAFKGQIMRDKLKKKRRK